MQINRGSHIFSYASLAAHYMGLLQVVTSACSTQIVGCAKIIAMIKLFSNIIICKVINGLTENLYQLVIKKYFQIAIHNYLLIIVDIYLVNIFWQLVSSTKKKLQNYSATLIKEFLLQ